MFEGGLLAVAFLGGWLLDCPPTAALTWSFKDFGLGLLATVPMLVVLAICALSRSAAMLKIRAYQRDTVGHLLDECRWYDIALLAAPGRRLRRSPVSGVSVLMAGTIQFRDRCADFQSGLRSAHAATPMYGILAAFLGIYLTAADRR